MNGHSLRALGVGMYANDSVVIFIKLVIIKYYNIMANIQAVILKGEAPKGIELTNEVRWYGSNPIKTIDNNSSNRMFGDTIIYTRSAKSTVSKLVKEYGYNKEDLVWQDLDAYGEDVGFNVNFKLID